MQILIVDDSTAMRKILRRIVETLGFKVVEAGHGIEAMQQLGSFPTTEVALVDWNMPEMNGLDFVKAVRANPLYEQTKLVMVTSETDPTKMARAMMAGADEFLMKPFTAEMLLDKLHLIGLTMPRVC
jgi:two-component system chemotaxis response regulator CheY